MQAMAEWYVKGDMDQGRLSRILDVAQDLKARFMMYCAHCCVLCKACLLSVKDGAVMFSMCIFLEYQSYMYKGSKLLITVTAVSNVGSNIFMVYLRPCPCY